MSTTTNDVEPKKPFWLRPPWIVLFDLIKLHQIKPWNIDLSFLLSTLLGEMEKKGSINFTASGIALLSSATLFRMKSELILKLQEPPTLPQEKIPMEFLPPPLKLPYRFDYTSTTIDHLIKVLEESLVAETSIETQPKQIPITPALPILKELDQFMIDIENKIEEMYQRISQLLKETDIISLSKLTEGFNRLEGIRIFSLILFIACRDQIRLWQEKDLGEIFISFPEERKSI
jgi:chromatin segregation and condensation protein Rec8/ScpA/Scc1 (kleisin family)